MGNINLHEAVTGWIAEELESGAREQVSWWIASWPADPPWAAPHVMVFVVWGETTSSAYVPWPPDEEHVRKSARSALAEIGLLRPEAARS